MTARAKLLTLIALTVASWALVAGAVCAGMVAWTYLMHSGAL